MKLTELLALVPKNRRNEAIWLVTGLLGLTRSDVFLSPDRELTRAQAGAWRRAWERRRKGEPLQYICGIAPFWGREFLVNRNVLIPRPETERLVELSLGLLAGRNGARVIDAGTGSGIVAVTLKLERPDLTVFGTDVSASALRIAKKNAARFGAEVGFVKRDGIGSLANEVDLIVSNPPYLNFSLDDVSAEVRDWEPELALQPGRTKRVPELRDRGAWLVERFLRECAFLRPRFSAFELSPRIAALMVRKWRKHTAVERIWREADLSGRKRFLLVAWKNA